MGLTRDLVRARAAVAAAWFETAERDGGDEYVRLRAGRPDWVRDLVQHAHGDLLPDDWRYRTISDALEFIAESDDDPREREHEFADATVDVYTGARLAWLGSHLSRPGYCDDAVEDFGPPSPDGIVERAGLGQYCEAAEVFALVLDALEQLDADD